jgi:hypothetical protein
MNRTRNGVSTLLFLLSFVLVVSLGFSSRALCQQASSTPDQSGNFFQRLGNFYVDNWTGKAASGPAPARRAPDAPLDSAPFPSADWGYGGSPVIGTADGNVYPLMNALKLQDSRTKIYGWIAPSFNVSTSDKNNFPVAYDIFRTALS